MSDAAPVPAPAPASESPKLSAGQRLLAAFTSPAELFQDIVRKPTIVLPLAIFVVLAVVAGVALTAKLDMSSTFAKMSEAGMDEAKQEQAMKFVNITKWVAVGAAPITVPLGLAIISGIYFLVLKLLGSEQNDFGRMYSAILHAKFAPGVVKAVLAGIVSLTKSSIDPMQAGHLVKSNLGGFLPTDSAPALIAIGDSIDVFAIWEIVLMTLAISIVGRVSRTQAATVVLVFWFLTVVGKVGLAALSGLHR